MMPVKVWVKEMYGQYVVNVADSFQGPVRVAQYKERHLADRMANFLRQAREDRGEGLVWDCDDAETLPGIAPCG